MTIVKNIIKNPRITEKATAVSGQNVYTFDVAISATKSEVKKAIKAIYKVDPVKVNIASVKPKTVYSRGFPGIKSGGRKAYIYLKEEDKIDFI